MALKGSLLQGSRFWKRFQIFGNVNRDFPSTFSGPRITFLWRYFKCLISKYCCLKAFYWIIVIDYSIMLHKHCVSRLGYSLNQKTNWCAHANITLFYYWQYVDNCHLCNATTLCVQGNFCTCAALASILNIFEISRKKWENPQIVAALKILLVKKKWLTHLLDEIQCVHYTPIRMAKIQNNDNTKC